jgi:predicted Zn finger-like uncharacterized protein
MSLITRCPACGTMFKVVPDQLRISEGWVRCGNCAEVFDATASLLPPESAGDQQAVSHAHGHEGDSAAEAQPVAPASTVAPVPAPIPAVTSAPVVTRASAPADAADSIAAPPLYPWFPSEVHDSQLQREQREEEPDLEDVTFVRTARRKAFWARPLVRGVLLLLALLLTAVLVLQYAVQERDKLAALHPELRPLLQRVCQPVGCQVGPPRQIDAIVIDASSFSRLRTDAYRLTFTLRNQAPMQVAMPSIELTLTDTQDQPVIRRVLAPRDIGAASELPPSSDVAGTVAVAVTGAGTTRVAGYRLLAFYP